MRKKEKGITLIALVVTIVVLLILATVSISMLGGENGIITQAQNTKEQNEIAKEKEEISVAYNGAKTQKLGKEVNGEDMNEQFNINGTKAIARGERTITVRFTESGRIYTIESNGTINVSDTEWVDYNISSTMTNLYKYYVEGDTLNGYELKNNGEDYISIESKEELEYLSKYTNLGNQTENVIFILLNDINLNPGITFNSDGTITGGTPEVWDSIGKMTKIEIVNEEDWNNKVNEFGKLYTTTNVSTSYSSYSEYYNSQLSFKGIIDGQGYAIEGMYIDNEWSGLIGVSDGAIIQNLIMKNNYLNAKEGVGSFVSKVLGKGILIKNSECYDNYFYITGEYIGGYIGASIEGNIQLENLSSNNIIEIERGNSIVNFGGIAGQISASTVKIFDCSNSTVFNANIEDTYLYSIGGIVGELYHVNEALVDNCHNNADLAGYEEVRRIIWKSELYKCNNF